MSATSKNYNMTESDLLEIYRIVEHMCNNPHTDTRWTLHIPNHISMSNDYDVLVNSIIFRTTYGGMHGDINMLFKIIDGYSLGTIRSICIENKVINKYDDYLIGVNITDGDIIPEAIDFHCCPDMLQSISKSCEFRTDYIKSLIWNFSSKINTRNNTNISDMNDDDDNDNDNDNDNKYYADFASITQIINNYQLNFLDKFSSKPAN
jgi:hypothetical protein